MEENNNFENNIDFSRDMPNLDKYKEKELSPMSGFIGLLIVLILFVGAILCFVFSNISGILVVVGILLMIAFTILVAGFRTVHPNEAVVLLLFGKYKGTIKKEGFWYVNPFSRPAQPGKMGKINLKANTLNNEKQKVNDLDGNPIEIGVVVIWRVVDTVKASFAVENYSQYVSTQADAAIRQVARMYPYDINGEESEKTLRGSATEISDELRKELQERCTLAGVEIMEARIAHLAYAPEIAQAMLQRQQASAVIEARQMIVDGAVGMVEMALNKLEDGHIVQLDEERKAQMVSNLLVVLCGNKDAQPILNTSTLY